MLLVILLGAVTLPPSATTHCLQNSLETREPSQMYTAGLDMSLGYAPPTHIWPPHIHFALGAVGAT